MLVVGFQLYDAIGWLGQILFTLRVLVQWRASERAGRSVVPRSFWTISVQATLLLLVYQGFHRGDPVFLAGLLVNLAIYVRNLSLLRATNDEAVRGPRRGGPWLPLASGLVAFAVFVAVTHERLAFDTDPAWLAVGFASQAIWSSRFVLQWIASERLGESHLPPVFFWMSLVGSVGLFAYAVHQVDWVMMFAYVLHPLPTIRNLVLIRRRRHADLDRSGGDA